MINPLMPLTNDREAYDIQKANEGPFDKRMYPPKWAFEPITDEEYERQKTEYESVSTTDAEIINCSKMNK